MPEPKFTEVFARPEDMQDTAIALLRAAGDTPEVVQTVSGGFRTTVDVAEAAGFGTGTDGAVDAAKAESDDARADVVPVLAHGIENPTPAQLVDANPSATLPAALALTEELGGNGAAEPDANPAVTAAKANTQAQAEMVAAGPDAGFEKLTGKALDKALEDANLSKTGSVVEKQARLAGAQGQ